MADFGTDISCHVAGDGTWDLDPTFAIISGERVLLESMARAIQTARGTMADEPDRGIDLAAFENARTTAGAARTSAAAIEAELARDERLDEVSVSMKINCDTWELEVEGLAGGGPFRFVFSIDADRVSIVTGAAGA